MLSQTELRQQITDKIIDSLKAGKMPWRKVPFKSDREAYRDYLKMRSRMPRPRI